MDLIFSFFVNPPALLYIIVIYRKDWRSTLQRITTTCLTWYVGVDVHHHNLAGGICYNLLHLTVCRPSAKTAT